MGLFSPGCRKRCSGALAARGIGMKRKPLVVRTRGLAATVALLVIVLAAAAAIVTRTSAKAREAAAGERAHLPRFLVGADVSDFGYIESHGGVYRLDGKPMALPRIFRRAGCNTLRLRLWHDASSREKARLGLYNTLNTIDYTLPLAARIMKSGVSFVLNMHLSDTWADPQKQRTPYDWRGLGYRMLRRRVFNYTKQVMIRFREAHAMPAIVMVGNEVNHGILWPLGKLKPHDPRSWQRFTGLLKSAIAGVDAGSGSRKPQIMIQVGNFTRPRPVVRFFSKLVAADVPFDLIGYDYYPYWGGPTANLRRNLRALAVSIGKPIIVAETAYPWSKEHNKSWAAKAGMTYPFSPQGQRAYIAHVIAIVKALPNHLGRGVWWWGAEFTADQRMFLRAPWSYRSLFDSRGNALPALRTLCSAAVP